jgi:hypothetical protein
MKTIFLSAFIFWQLCATAQFKIDNFANAEIYFQGLFNAGFEKQYIDEYGNIGINMGSASDGRIYFRITDVKISMEEKPQEPGCADICPPRVIIHFECIKSGCVRDFTNFDMAPTQSGTIVIFDVPKGKKAYEFLMAFQKFVGE